MIQEFKVQSHNDKAELGGATGGVVKMYSKSGSNEFHGSAYEYTRNEIFDARKPFQDAARDSPSPSAAVRGLPSTFLLGRMCSI